MEPFLNLTNILNAERNKSNNNLNFKEVEVFIINYNN